MLNNKMVGKNIKRARNNQLLTQQQLAEEADLSVTHIAHLECGTVSLSVNSLITLCRILNVTPNDILRGSFNAEEKSDEKGLYVNEYPLEKKNQDFIMDVADLLTKYQELDEKG